MSAKLVPSLMPVSSIAALRTNLVYTLPVRYDVNNIPSVGRCCQPEPHADSALALAFFTVDSKKSSRLHLMLGSNVGQ
eukprot:scaffold403078_cov18-Prasinocladus_malaysianus.AAC.2